MSFTAILRQLLTKIIQEEDRKEELIEDALIENISECEDEENILSSNDINVVNDEISEEEYYSDQAIIEPQIDSVLLEPQQSTETIEHTVKDPYIGVIIEDVRYDLKLNESNKYENVLDTLNNKEQKQINKEQKTIFSYEEREQIFVRKIGQTFSFMYEKYYKKLTDWIFTYIKNREVSEDLACECLMKSLERIDTFDTSKDIQYVTWLYVIARNHSLAYMKKNSNKTITMDAEIDESGSTLKDYLSEDVDENSQVENEVDIAQMKVNVIKDKIKLLDEKYQQALILRDFKQLSYEEISTMLNIGINTTKSRIHSARNKIAELVKKDFEEIEKMYDE